MSQPPEASAVMDFFESEPRARTNDPETSHTAARAIVADGTVSRMMARTLRAVREHPGLCSNELEDLMGVKNGVFRKRLSELERRGLIRRGPARKSTSSGRVCETWEPV